MEDLIKAINDYKKASDDVLNELLVTRIDGELDERISSLCLSYDEHMILNILRDKIKG